MAANAGFAATVLVGSVLVPSTNDTSLTAPTHTALVVTAGASGSRIDVIRAFAVGTTVAGRLNIFRYDGSTYWLVDQFMVTATTPGSGVEVWADIHNYDTVLDNMLLLGASDKLYCTVMEASNESLICVTAMGGSF